MQIDENKEVVRRRIREVFATLYPMELGILALLLSKGGIIKNQTFYRRIVHLCTEQDGNALSSLAKEEFDALIAEATTHGIKRFEIGDRVKINPLALGDDKYRLAEQVGNITDIRAMPGLQYADVRFRSSSISLSVPFANLGLFYEEGEPVWAESAGDFGMGDKVELTGETLEKQRGGFLGKMADQPGTVIGVWVSANQQWADVSWPLSTSAMIISVPFGDIRLLEKSS